MSQTRERYFELTLLGLILILGSLLFYEALPFLNGILGAITLYIMLRRTNIYLCNRCSKSWAPWIITLGVTVFVMIPLSAILWYLIDLVQNVDIDVQVIIKRFTDAIRYIEQTTNIHIASDKTVSFLTARASSIMNMLMSGINNTAVNLFTAILVLFFLLAGGMAMERRIARCLPFSDDNKRTVINKVSSIVRSNAIGIPLLAILQGVVSAVGYSLCSVPNPIEFGALTGFASMIPIVGTMLVWVPLAVMQYFEQGLMSAIYVAAYGMLIISQCDNVLRMFLQKRLANTHPLVTIFGVIAGLPLFGFMGLIFGPLLVAMFLLFLEMFISEYIIGHDPNTRNQSSQNFPVNVNMRTPKNTSGSRTPASETRSQVRSGLSTRLTPVATTTVGTSKAKNTAPHSAVSQSTVPKVSAPKSAENKGSARPLKGNDPRNNRNKDERYQHSEQSAQQAAPVATAAPAAVAATQVTAAAPAAVAASENKAVPEHSRQNPASGQGIDLNAAPIAPAASSNAARHNNDFKTGKAGHKQQKREGARLRTLEEQKARERELARRTLGLDQGVNDMAGYNHNDNRNGQSLVSRAVNQAIFALDKLDDLDHQPHLGSPEPMVLTHPSETMMDALLNQQEPSADKAHDDAVTAAAVSPKAAPKRDDRNSRPRNRKQESEGKAHEMRTRTTKNAGSAGSGSARSEFERSGSSSEHRNHKDQEAAKNKGKNHQEPKSRAKSAGALSRANKMKRNRKERREHQNAQGYQYLRPERPRRQEPEPIIRTVVSHQYGGFGTPRHRPQLQTRLISVHTAKGTMMAEPPRRHPSKRRPYH